MQFGGPTIEMVMNSYSQSHNVQYIAQATNTTGYVGYQISKDNGETWESSYAGMLNKNTSLDSLYVIKNASPALAMWTASPSAYSTSTLAVIGCNGSVGNDYYANNVYDNTAIGFRPVICLNSNVILQESNGTYTIQ